MNTLKLVLSFLALAAGALASPGLVYFGTYSDAGGRGIYAARFDADDGSLSAPFLAGEAHDPGFLAFGPKDRFLYAVDEKGGGVGAYAVDSESGKLTLINRRPTEGTSSAHLAIDPTGRMLIVANYGSGTVITYPLGSDGAIGPRVQFFPQRGPPGPNRKRQSEAHPHSVVFSPDARFAFICDLGLDRIFIYRVDAAEAKLTPAAAPFATVPPGSGPRHSVFSPDARSYYAVDEIGGTVSSFAYDAATGGLRRLQTLSTLADTTPLNGSAEIRIHPSGRWVYASNRNVNGHAAGSDSLAVFARNPDSGKLKRIQVIPCGGKMPRCFDLDASGRWLVCAHQDSNDVSVFRVDPSTGKLSETGARIAVSRPVCVLFYR